MRYIFYADIYFLQNFIIKSAVLSLLLFFNKKHQAEVTFKGLGKIFFLSLLGTLFEMLGLFLIRSYQIFVIGVYIVEVPLMVWMLLRKEGGSIIKSTIMGYFYMMLINGFLESLWNQFGMYGGYIFYLILASGGVIVGVYAWKNYQNLQKGIFTVTVSHCKKNVITKGFYDSGNRLVDPYTKKGVHIISNKLIRNLSEGVIPVYIPYQALGNETGLLEVYYIDELIVEKEKQKIHIINCPLGVTKDNLFDGKNYEIILNEEVF